ncbi:phosphotransferase [Mycobacterium sp. GA-2829]|uniref:phosphotransferase n=1 Tax=Mycobacterium sp. GA-2829 TaxID=1772283 RepID=UPI0009EABFAD|nr:phosphotransferase [Mycobacterium sp. GA-2829]
MPTSATAEIPSGIDDLTPQWLTEVLRADHALPATVTVTALRAERIAEDSGFSSLLYRVHLSGDGVPPTLIAKFAAVSEARGAMELLGGYRREVAYYRDVAGHAPMDSPHVYAAAIAPDSADFVLLLEDLQGWDNADHLAGLTLAQTRTCLAALAGLHAWSVTDAEPVSLQAFPSIDTPIARDLLVPAFAAGWDIYREHTEARVPTAVARYAERFTDHAPTALTALGERSMLLHGDIRADNLFFDGDRLKVVDFQFASRGCGAADVAYLVSQGLPTAVRSGHDEALVRDYLDHLTRGGVTDYAFDEAWRHYRVAVAYLIVLPVITLIGWDGLPQRSRELCLTLTDRAVAAIDETDALAVFG